MELRKGYKQTAAGVIPEDWDCDYIRNFSLIATGSKNTQDQTEDGLYPFFVRSSTIERINTYSFDGEAVLTAGDGVGTGKVFHYIKGKFDFHQRVYRMSDFSERVDGYFFYLYFSNHFYTRIMSMTAKSSVDSVRMEMIANMAVPLPPLTEQRAIATAIGEMDALATSLNDIIAKKYGVKRALTQRLLAGQQRPADLGVPTSGGKHTATGTTSDDWEARRFPSVARVTTGQVDPRVDPYRSMILVAPDHVEGSTGRLLCRKSASDQGAISGKYIFNPGDVVYSKIRPYLRKAFLANFRGLCSADMYPLSVSRDVSPGFLLAVLLGDHFSHFAESASARSGIPKINRNELAEYTVALPPLSDQTMIANVISDMDSEIFALEQQRDKTRAIKQAVMQELLTGRTRLV